MLKALSLLPFTSVEEMERNEALLDKHAVPHPDYFIDYFWGNASLESFLYILRNLPPGVSEVAVHVGTNTREGNYPSGLETDYFPLRERELAVICSEEAANAIRNLGIRLTMFSELSGPTSTPSAACTDS